MDVDHFKIVEMVDMDTVRADRPVIPKYAERTRCHQCFHLWISGTVYEFPMQTYLLIPDLTYINHNA